ncbi:NHL repeat-containing protein 2 [Diachasma alloeum]|uniref:NHL repeat-containing protein 2 n=1 Tax=Diachasma alloeum TaxID=454923 RepID=UPI0007382A04|nr:NHL repeat-containing protein 2 [Diachasma alloeum]
MCGQENKAMSVQDTVEILTQECIELRRILAATSDDREKEKIVLKHIISRANSDLHVNDFQKGLEWFNVSEGLSMSKHLAGKIVVLDFFTYCCINCMHILPDLEAVEKKYTVEDGLVIIGVHSAKFSNEKDSAKILSAVQRYNILHPVVNDAKLSMWRDIGISCWPSLVILGPQAQPLVVLVGEGHREELFLYTKVALSYFKSHNAIRNHDLPVRPAQHLLPVSTKENLLFPGKVIGFEDENEDKIIVSDTGNNRIIIIRLDGTVEHVIGGYSPGLKDGSFEMARFNAPQGVCHRGDSIYVADNENHAIRLIDLKSKSVTTLAGTGSQGHDYQGGKIGKAQAISSPWDVALYDYKENEQLLIIAMAGTHQIWALFLQDTVWWKNKEYKAGSCAAIVGNGREANRNNTYPHAASLAQPSGLAISPDSKILFFADSESSSIRKIYLQDGRVSPLAGADKNPQDLHNFGDVDGIQYCAKFQHPLGVTWDSKREVVYVADTYNHKIKQIDSAGKCTTLYGAGKPSKDHVFDEPSGLGLLAKHNLLLIADTNNHCIKTINLESKLINTIADLKYPMKVVRPFDKVLDFSTEISNKEAEMTISFATRFTAGVEFTASAPQKWSLSHPESWTSESPMGSLSTPIKLELPEDDTPEELAITVNFVVCTNGQCIPRRLKILHRVLRKAGAPTNIEQTDEIEIL